MGPSAQSSSLWDLASNGITGGASFDGSQDHAWINRNGTAEILTSGQYGTKTTAVNAAGQAIGIRVQDNGGVMEHYGFFFDGTTVHDLGLNVIPEFLTSNGLVGGNVTNVAGFILDSTATGLPILPFGAITSVLKGLNENGDLAGYYSVTSGTTTDGPFAFGVKNGTEFNLAPSGTPYGEVVGINKSGDIAGCGCSGTGFVYYANTQTVVDLPSTSEILYTAPAFIADNGDVSGAMVRTDPTNGAVLHVFRFTPAGVRTDLNDGLSDSFDVDDMNLSGDIGGSSLSGPAKVFLHHNGATSYYDAQGRIHWINENGDAVGGDDFSVSFAILLGALYDLNDLNPAGSPFSSLAQAYYINDPGQIGGDGDLNGGQMAFLLTPDPVPEPATFALCGFAGAGLFAWHRRRRV